MARSAPLRIGTRGSLLALAQAHEVRRLLAVAHPELGDEDAVEITVIKTTGDRILDRPLAEAGGKGLFTKEIDEALLSGRIDVAVNCVKDLPTRLPAGVVSGCILEREDPRDALVSKSGASLDGLPAGSVIGTASLRRQAQVLHRRPDLGIVMFRGNVDTRLRKLAEGQADATLLALAGLKRLGREDVATAVLDLEEMVPAVGQGALSIACRAGDERGRCLLEPLHHEPTATLVTAERAMLDVLDGSCRTPIGGLARLAGTGTLTLTGLVARPDGTAVWRVERDGPVSAADALGRDVGQELRRRAGDQVFRGW